MNQEQMDKLEALLKIIETDKALSIKNFAAENATMSQYIQDLGLVFGGKARLVIDFDERWKSL